jgi:hypothetical protein
LQQSLRDRDDPLPLAAGDAVMYVGGGCEEEGYEPDDDRFR